MFFLYCDSQDISCQLSNYKCYDCHSCTYHHHYPVNVETCKALRKVWLTIRGYDPETDYCPSTQTDIDNAVELATGAPSFTFEFGLTSAPSHERLVDEGFGILKAVFLYGKDNVYADRRKIAGKK